MARAIYYKKDVMEIINRVLVNETGLIVMEQDKKPSDWDAMQMIRGMFNLALRVADELKEEEE